MKKIKSFTIKSISSLSNEEMHFIHGGSDERYYTECTWENLGSKCIYENSVGVCDYTYVAPNGDPSYYDTFCKV